MVGARDAATHTLRCTENCPGPSVSSTKYDKSLSKRIRGGRADVPKEMRRRRERKILRMILVEAAPLLENLHDLPRVLTALFH